MGVRGLQGFVGSTCPHICTVVNLRDLAERHQSRHPGCPPTIVVDAMCCLRYWYTPESWVCGGQWREYFSALRGFVETFTDVGIKLVFFFDGMVEQDKRAEWVKRRHKNSREISRIFHYVKSRGEQPGRHMFFIPPGLAVFTRLALRALGQETHCSLQEADYEVAARGLWEGCLGVLGEDTDYLIYNTCPYLSIRELCLDTLDTVMLCREKLCESLRLSVADLPLLACLLGNDIVPEGMFEGFRYKCLAAYTAMNESLDKRGSVILAVADHIARVLHLHQGEKTLEEMLPLGPNKALFYKGVTSYLLPGQKSPWFSPKSNAVVTLDKQISSLSSDPDSQPEIPRCADPDSQPEASTCTDPEIQQQGASGSYHEVQRDTAMVSDPEILKVAKAQHVQGESYLLYNILSSGEIECSNTLEDELEQALPSQAFVYRPVRQRVYALLLGNGEETSFCLEVKEWFVYAGNPLKQPDLVRPLPVSVPGGTPNLKTLWLTQEPGVQTQRFDVLLACFNLSSMQEDLQAVEGPLRALCCLLMYLFVQVDTLCLEDLQALIAQALCLQGTSTAQLMDLQLDHINSRAVQLGALFVRGLTTMVFVNSACGFPLDVNDFMPWNVFDGKLFHQKYLQSEKGYSVEVLLEQNRSRLTRFHSLKSVVVKACLRENRRIGSRQHWGSHHTGRWSRQGTSSQRTSSGHSRAGPGQPWRDQAPGSRQYEHAQRRRYSSSSGHILWVPVQIPVEKWSVDCFQQPQYCIACCVLTTKVRASYSWTTQATGGHVPRTRGCDAFARTKAIITRDRVHIPGVSDWHALAATAAAGSAPRAPLPRQCAWGRQIVPGSVREGTQPGAVGSLRLLISAARTRPTGRKWRVARPPPAHRPSVLAPARGDICCLLLTRHLFRRPRVPVVMATGGERTHTRTPALPVPLLGVEPTTQSDRESLSLGPSAQRVFHLHRPAGRRQITSWPGGSGRGTSVSRAVLHSWPAGNKRAIINERRLPSRLGTCARTGRALGGGGAHRSSAELQTAASRFPVSTFQGHGRHSVHVLTWTHAKCQRRRVTGPQIPPDTHDPHHFRT
ncbi:PREDICTED: constitutive coactivator of peroxisome proliferator-activated receptor gamma [Chrysochloris asiatica]|uniref:Constitutive coactivator of peroxisome proliferator-activated receptor gamma n=1 Tax=Chrysochloris asiatica TaxID=185453 RepID=A0A9B0U4U8_CHRAS|nr:PREDICTED: constitutive coactivator of peroxisome proliferator-activated receptor gamma [Chrysochloris asiatica]